MGGIILFLSSCQSSSADRASNPIALQLSHQIEQSCQTATAYQKQVFDLTEFAAQPQDSLFEPIPMVGVEGADDSMHCMLFKDLSYAFEAFHSEEGLADQFEVRQAGDSLIADIKPDYVHTSFLQKQIMVSSTDSETIRYFENQLKRDTWLYKMDIVLQVWFDSQGSYQRHSLELETRVSLINNLFHAQIKGKNIYP